jgi:hypothetical protein
MEQSLINELVKLLCKSGCETFVGNYQKMIDHDLHAEKWTEQEVREAREHIQYINEYFGKDEAIAIITSLVARYNINVNDLQLRPPTPMKKLA